MGIKFYEIPFYYNNYLPSPFDMLGTVSDVRNSVVQMTGTVLGLKISALKGVVPGQEHLLEWNIYTDGFFPIDRNV